MAIGREVQAAIADGFDEAADFVEVARRLWDSWEDDAEIRDVATGRFIDREKLHYIDFEGRWFSVRGPSIVPRPPQGQPVVTVLAHLTIPYRLGARAADVVYVTPRDEAGAAAIVAEVRAEQRAAGRADDTIHIFGDLVVFLDGTAAAAAAPVPTAARNMAFCPARRFDRNRMARRSTEPPFQLWVDRQRVDIPALVRPRASNRCTVRPVARHELPCDAPAKRDAWTGSPGRRPGSAGRTCRHRRL